MFAMMMMLAVASTMVEMMFAANFPAWRRNAHKYKWVNMVISITLSFILGIAFGAQGLIVMGGAMISTAFSIPGYALLHYNYDTETARRYKGGMFQHGFNKWKQVISDFFKILYKILRLITAPIWITRAALVKYNAYKSRRTASA
jgi:hypothetical protein